MRCSLTRPRVRIDSHKRPVTGAYGRKGEPIYIYKIEIPPTGIAKRPFYIMLITDPLSVPYERLS